MSSAVQIGGPRLKSWMAALGFLLAALFPAAGGAAAGAASPEVILSSPRASQGEVLFLRVRAGQGEAVRVSWMDMDLPLVKLGQGEWCGFLGIDLKSVPRVYPLKVSSTPSGAEKILDIEVQTRDYGERRLTLPREKVDLDEAALARARREAAEMKAVLEAPPAAPLWDGPFVAPLEGEITGLFGRRNIINGQARSPHSGVDLRADLGVPIQAINHGRVVLTSDQFFSGLSVVIDHGGGIHSMYFHLDKILVRHLQQVRRGEVVGNVGSTGRSTGPHLHFGVRVNGARVDPFGLISLSKGLE